MAPVLQRQPEGFPPDGHVRPQLAQFDVDLAIWLARPARRATIACWQPWKLVHNPTVLMTYRNPRILLGRAAAGVLRSTKGPCVMRDVFEPVLAAAEPPSDGTQPPAS